MVEMYATHIVRHVARRDFDVTEISKRREYASGLPRPCSLFSTSSSFLASSFVLQKSFAERRIFNEIKFPFRFFSGIEFFYR